ncbi:MAG: GNAT family N-acetyltransferase [Terriglobales bacterium]
MPYPLVIYISLRVERERIEVIAFRERSFPAMNSIENRVSAAILTIIRARRDSPQVQEGDGRIQSSVPSVKFREATFSDFDGVSELKQRWGLVPDTLEDWERLWRLNPALKQAPPERPIGWVLEAEGRVVGYLGNISLIYRYGGDLLSVVTGHAFVVDPEYRAVSLTLVAAFYRQKSVDLYLTTTGIETVGRIAIAFKCEPLPQGEYGNVLLWVLRPYPFAQALMRKLNVNPTLAQVGSVLSSLAIGTDKVLRGRRPRQDEKGLTVREIAVREIGEDFKALWIEKLKESPQLLADRSPASLRWHFQIPGHRGTIRLLCCYRNGELLGYAVIRNDKNRLTGLRRSLLADMLVKKNDADVLTTLFVSAYAYAEREGCDVLEILGFPPAVRHLCSQWNPYLRKYPACPFYYKASDPLLHKVLSEQGVWYASPFDGDTTLMP